MSDDPRNLLSIGQRALATGQLAPAHDAFLGAAVRFSGPSELLGGGHGWRGIAQVAIVQKEWGRATRMLELAERTYHLGVELLEDVEDPTGAFRTGLLEGRATIGTLRADMAIRRLRYAEARRAIDAVYPLYRELGDRPCVADLWVTTARLAEREGRWFSARTAWAQVLRVRKANGDELGQCDALIRMAEAMIVEDELDKAKKKLDEAEDLARYLEDDTLKGRVHLAVAKILEHEHAWEAAWEKWLDAQHALRDADPLLRGLSQVRMARTAVRVRPSEAGDYLQRGLIALLDAHHPDAIGLVLHQLAIVALVNGDARTALLASVGADRSRGGDDGVQGVVLRSLLQLRELDAAYKLALVRHDHRPEPDRQVTLELIEGKLDEVPDLKGTSPRRMREAAQVAIDIVLGPLARSHGLDVLEVASRRAAMKLTGAATAPGAAERIASAVREAREKSDEKRAVLLWEMGDGDPQMHVLRPGLSLIGRGGGNAVRMGWDPKASRVHCAVELVGDEVRLKDLSSSGGTWVDDDQIHEEVVLTDQRFRVGDTLFWLEWRAVRTHTAVAAAVALQTHDVPEEIAEGPTQPIGTEPEPPATTEPEPAASEAEPEPMASEVQPEPAASEAEPAASEAEPAASEAEPAEPAGSESPEPTEPESAESTEAPSELVPPGFEPTESVPPGFEPTESVPEAAEDPELTLKLGEAPVETDTDGSSPESKPSGSDSSEPADPAEGAKKAQSPKGEAESSV